MDNFCWRSSSKLYDSKNQSEPEWNLKFWFFRSCTINNILQYFFKPRKISKKEKTEYKTAHRIGHSVSSNQLTYTNQTYIIITTQFLQWIIFLPSRVLGMLAKLKGLMYWNDECQRYEFESKENWIKRELQLALTRTIFYQTNSSLKQYDTRIISPSATQHRVPGSLVRHNQQNKIIRKPCVENFDF